jgi:hypothetical protein
MLAPVTHILPLTNIRRARVLPAAGRVLVHVDQKVNAVDAIAEMPMAYRHTLVDIWRALGLAPGEHAERTLRVKIGMKVMEGDVIAETGGLFHRVVRAPCDGEIVTIGGGQVMIQTQTEILSIKAGITGVVKELVPDRGAIIEADGALVQGVWGNGRVDQGTMISLLKNPDDEFTPAQLDVSMRGGVVLAGHCASADALKTAGELPLRGLILGSMTSDLLPVANRLQLPLILLEGLGKLPINRIAYKILTTNEKREICLNAASNDLFSGDRPEIFIPLPANGQLAPETDEFAPGQMVRIHGMPYEQQTGDLMRLHPAAFKLPSGLRAPSADVLLVNGSQVTVPLANLDVLE